MAVLKNVVTVFVLSTILAVCFGQRPQGGPHESQGGPHQIQGSIQRQIYQNEEQGNNVDQTVSNVWQNPQNWTTCDFAAISKTSCHDCNTRIICKPIGGLLKPCNNPNKPYCNTGICSSIASPACV